MSNELRGCGSVASDAGVEFIIIGQWSAILHGSVHVTNDLDVFFRKPDNLRRLVEALTLIVHG